MAANKTIVLITGANGGIGFALAKLLVADASKHVLLGSRSEEKGKAAVKELESLKHPGSVELLHVDVDSEDSIAAAAKSVDAKHGRLDALVNNAAIAFGSGKTAQSMAACFKTNAIGAWLMGTYFIPLLKKASGTPRIVNVSSGAGNISRRLTSTAPKMDFEDIQYRASKAAMNMVHAAQANDLGPQGFKVFAYCPGFTVSSLGPHNKLENGAKPTSEGAAPIVKMLNGERDAEHGKFLTATGQYPEW